MNPTPQGIKTDAVSKTRIFHCAGRFVRSCFYQKNQRQMTEQHIHIILRHTDGGKWLAYTQGEKYRGKYHKDPTTAIVKAILRGRIKI